MLNLWNTLYRDGSFFVTENARGQDTKTSFSRQDRAAVLRNSGNCGDLHKTNRRTSQSVLQHGLGKGLRVLTLAKELLTVDGSSRRKSWFSLKVWPLIS